MVSVQIKVKFLFISLWLRVYRVNRVDIFQWYNFSLIHNWASPSFKWGWHLNQLDKILTRTACHSRSRVSRVDRQQSNTAVLPNHSWLAPPNSWSSGIVLVMKLEKLVTRAYTPGLFRLAQPSPKLTTPACTQVPLTIGQTRGPPESPWAEHTTHIQHWPLGGVKVLWEEDSKQLCLCSVCVLSKYKEAYGADWTVPGRSPCRPPGIQHRAYLAGCPPYLWGLSGTCADMNSGKWLALGLPVKLLLLAKGLVEYNAKKFGLFFWDKWVS